MKLTAVWYYKQHSLDGSSSRARKS
jgi:hypothetical protein